MHAGFAELRNNMPMNIRASYPGKGMTPAVRADIERITGLWRDCRKRFAGAAPKDDGFLFGAIGAADAMYAPGRHALSHLRRARSTPTPRPTAPRSWPIPP